MSMKSVKKPDLSVIILNYNTADFLAGCLRSVKRAVVRVRPLVVEVIVVDNGSTDTSVQMVHKQFGWVQCVVSRKNVGFAAGNNLGLSHARGTLILFLNSDTIVVPTAFCDVVQFLRQKPQGGALTVKTLLADGRLDPDCHRGFPTPLASLTYFLGLEKLFPMSRFFGQYHKAFLDTCRHHQIDAGAGAFMLVKREVIEAVGNWDEEYFFYGEDLDFYYRIKRAGWQVWYFAKPVVTHFKGVSSGLRKESRSITQASRGTRLRVAKESVRAMEIFYRKFYAGRYPAVITSLVLAGIRLKGWARYARHWLQR